MCECQHSTAQHRGRVQSSSGRLLACVGARLSSAARGSAFRGFYRALVWAGVGGTPLFSAFSRAVGEWARATAFEPHARRLMTIRRESKLSLVSHNELGGHFLLSPPTRPCYARAVVGGRWLRLVAGDDTSTRRRLDSTRSHRIDSTTRIDEHEW